MNPSPPLKKIKVEEAAGFTLAHDITEIRPGEFKGVAFRRGQIIEEKDICHLMKLGKRHLYVLEHDDRWVHEDDAVRELAPLLAGAGIAHEETPREGKLALTAAHEGLLKVNVESLVQFNLHDDVMCASLHTNTPVSQGQKIAGTRAIPLLISRQALDEAKQLLIGSGPIFTIKPYKRSKARLIVTGSEIFNGLIEDKFEAIVRKKMAQYGSELVETAILPDDREAIAAKLKEFFAKPTDLIITTGGMSVDPDDVTRLAVRDAGVERAYYSSAVLPGAMFQLAYKGDLPIAGIPACALYHETTVFDLILPRLLAGEAPAKRDLALLAHGGLCRDCAECRYPACSFGKAGE
ncbi:MAG: molybdopterin-binding protein [Desulfobacteraceae bacterium]|nr:molybdopterin-binding protein [Desulfobacteraceae bacterium]